MCISSSQHSEQAVCASINEGGIRKKNADKSPMETMEEVKSVSELVSERITSRQRSNLKEEDTQMGG